MTNFGQLTIHKSFNFGEKKGKIELVIIQIY